MTAAGQTVRSLMCGKISPDRAQVVRDVRRLHKPPPPKKSNSALFSRLQPPSVRSSFFFFFFTRITPLLSYISASENEQQPLLSGPTSEPQLTALYFQGAVLLVQRVPPQVHHAGRRRGDSGSTEIKEGGRVFDKKTNKQKNLRLCS